MSLSLSILIPCYNEAKTIASMIRRAADQKSLVRQIVIANDGSTDSTRQVLDNLKASWTDPSIDLRIIHLERNQGKGAAVRAALEVAAQPYVLIQDADLELDPGDYAALTRPIDEKSADVVFGNRFPNGFPRDLRYASRIANWVVTTLSNVLYGMHLEDQACGYKLLPTGLAKNLRLRSDGFEICSEMTAKLGLCRARIESVPVHYAPRDLTQGKKIRWIDGFIGVYALVKYRL